MKRQEYRVIPGWPDYEINCEGTVRRISTQTVLTPYNGQVRLVWTRKHRTWRKVSGLLKETFRKEYVPPVMKDLSFEGEIWKRSVSVPDCMVSNCGRVWSFRKPGFVGTWTRYGARVVTVGGVSRVVKKMMGECFGFALPCLNGEEWRRIDELPDYAISNYGRIWSDKRSCIMGMSQNTKGYIDVRIGRRNYRVHRLVATAFCSNDDPANKTQVDHINESKIDNRACNLRWCTGEENRAYYAANHPIPPSNLSGDFA